MIVEAIIGSVTAITIVGTWLGLRFAEKTLSPEEVRDKKRDAAIELARRSIDENSAAARDRVRALLITEPESLPDDVRDRVCEWLGHKRIDVSKATKEPRR